MRKIELLAPAKNIDIGIAAVNFGADAVYIGPNKFGAREAAGNSIQDIELLANYAKRYHAKVFATLNTILYDVELEEAQVLIHQLYNAGVDALIIQDMGILEMDLPPIPIHASTQANNISPEKVVFLENAGIQRVVLGRELSLKEIETIRKKSNIELEYFVHGALCVSYSGQCYMSASIGGRSANRGSCAQPCRKMYDLVDANGKQIASKKHLLSLRDLNHSDNLENIIDAGIDSLKIEGRLKDLNYVQNVVAHYRQKLDGILERKSDVQKASSGKVYYDFTSDTEKSFNRGFTNYFLNERSEKVGSPDSPKSMGKRIGTILEVKQKFFTISGKETLSNNDGLCLLDRNRTVVGIKVNRVEGSKVFPLSMKGLFPGAVLYRNFDAAFDKKLKSSKTNRRIALDIEFKETKTGFILDLCDEDEVQYSEELMIEKQTAENAELSQSNIEKQLKKLGNTIFECRLLNVDLKHSYFIPAKVLNEARRNAVESLEKKRLENHLIPYKEIKKTIHSYPVEKLSYKGNVTNKLARQFYNRHGVKEINDGFEMVSQISDAELMITKHCIKYELGFCPKYQISDDNWKEPFYLLDGNKRFRLEFDCKKCVMKVFEGNA